MCEIGGKIQQEAKLMRQVEKKKVANNMF